MNVFDWKQEINNHYPADRKVRGILIAHSRSVATLALEIAHRLSCLWTMTISWRLPCCTI